MVHGDEREEGDDNSRATHDGVIVVAMSAVVLTGLIWVVVAVALGFAGVVRVLDVLGELLGPVARRKWTAVERERKNNGRLTQRHRRRREGDDVRCVIGMYVKKAMRMRNVM